MLPITCLCRISGDHADHLPVVPPFHIRFAYHALAGITHFINQAWQHNCSLLSNKAACRGGKDKKLHDVIASDILPQLIESVAARRRAEEKQAAIEAMPKKRSSRLQVPHLFLSIITDFQGCYIIGVVKLLSWTNADCCPVCKPALPLKKLSDRTERHNIGIWQEY